MRTFAEGLAEFAKENDLVDVLSALAEACEEVSTDAEVAKSRAPEDSLEERRLGDAEIAFDRARGALKHAATALRTAHEKGEMVGKGRGLDALARKLVATATEVEQCEPG